MRVWVACLLAGMMLTGCADQAALNPFESADESAAEQPADAATAQSVENTPQTEAAAPPPDAPHIYMALQFDDPAAVSIVFAIDAARDSSPSDDPAIRLTPEGGKCNPQDLRRYAFPEETTRRPIFGPDEAVAGVTARDLPKFMAMAVTSEMLRQGLIDDVEASKPQNVCTRKLWERMIINESIQQG
ncbi:MAG: hypothetical protein AAF439_09065 [Pseudomonadota bacterium]